MRLSQLSQEKQEKAADIILQLLTALPPSIKVILNVLKWSERYKCWGTDVNVREILPTSDFFTQAKDDLLDYRNQNCRNFIINAIKMANTQVATISFKTMSVELLDVQIFIHLNNSDVSVVVNDDEGKLASLVDTIKPFADALRNTLFPVQCSMMKGEPEGSFASSALFAPPPQAAAQQINNDSSNGEQVSQKPGCSSTHA